MEKVDSVTPLHFEFRAIDDLDALKDAVVAHQESHLRRYPMQWLSLAMLYFEIKTCLDELIVNIFKHGYPDKHVAPLVTVKIHGDERELVVQVTDNAKPFDLTRHVAKSDHVGDETVVLGIGLIRKLVDDIEYTPLANGNQVTLRKRTME